MINIIVQGKLEKPVVRFHCTRCKTIFEADGDDLEEYSSYWDDAWKAICPCCNNIIYQNKKYS